jgi:uncharacterized protein (TIGR03663 family)
MKSMQTSGLKLLSWEKILWACILVAVFIFCFSHLPLKPPHSDEGVNGFFVNTLWEKGFYTYDPNNYHGPLLFYLFQISEKIFGFGILSFRIISAMFLVLTVVVILKSRDVLGSSASLFIAIALGLSPGMIFFSRSAIHEPVFVFFQIVWMIGFLKSRKNLNKQGLLWFFTGFFGCVVLKETFLILGVAFLLAWLWLEVSPKILERFHRQAERPHQLALADIPLPFVLKITLTGVFVLLLLFTGFLNHWKGASDFFITLMPWLKTGVGGSGHDKPLFHWITLLLRYEWIASFGVVLSCIGLFHCSWKIRFFSALALINAIIYSVIPYKTPWCIMSILWPLVFVTGLLFEYLVVTVRPRYRTAAILLSVFLIVGLGHAAVVGYKLNFRQYADPREPYVYVQTKEDVTVIGDIIREKIEASPHYQNMTVWISLKDTWPLTWIFSRFPHVSFGEADVLTPKADVIFAEESSDGSQLDGLYWMHRMELRDAREPISVYLRKSVFDKRDVSGFNNMSREKGE